MAIEQTLSIIKPDAVAKNVIGLINSRFEHNGLKIIAAKMLQLSLDEAKKFYSIHQDKNFFSGLVSFMSSGPILVQVLSGENAVLLHRKIMGATNPSEAEAGTIRADFAESIDCNAVHGSDSLVTAAEEIAFFFKPNEIFAVTRS
jgi:nucleoside-diphosphate kinase